MAQRGGKRARTATARARRRRGAVKRAPSRRLFSHCWGLFSLYLCLSPSFSRKGMRQKSLFYIALSHSHAFRFRSCGKGAGTGSPPSQFSLARLSGGGAQAWGAALPLPPNPPRPIITSSQAPRAASSDDACKTGCRQATCSPPRRAPPRFRSPPARSAGSRATPRPCHRPTR